ncbi:MAG: glycosyltransferase [Candidatus Omnitrophica bacterium]|nr:glycosyltransferase [Candidatus Omnitrophota bacterium]
MKILLIMDPDIPVPPVLYGGHERLVYFFAKQYSELGHDVTVLAGPGSKTAGNTVIYGKNENNRTKSIFTRFGEIFFVWSYLLKNSCHFDLIHNFGRLAYFLSVLNKPVNKIMTYGRHIHAANIKKVCSLASKNIVFTGCSNSLISQVKDIGDWHCVYNAIDFSQYELKKKVADDAPLIFLGRVEKIKGVHTAIKVALATGNKLVIAGNKAALPHDEVYFKEQIEPYIDQKQIIYVGSVDDIKKNHYLGQAKALLFPIEIEEPFGIVMIEAMACGTPVIGFNRGSIPEVIDDGVTGFVVRDLDEMVDKIRRINQIDRNRCRLTAERRFDVSVVAEQYLRLFN